MIVQALRQIAALLGLALLPAFVSGAIQLQPHRAERAEPITPAEILASAQEFVWVDTCTQADFDAGHASGATRLTVEDWDPLIPPILDAWHPDKMLIVYGPAGEEVAARLRKDLQVKNVRALKGDWQRWKAK